MAAFGPPPGYPAPPSKDGRIFVQTMGSTSLCYQSGGESESGLGPIGSPDNWRCVVFEKLRRVELLNGSWKTAPNHSRPASCIVDADIDAEDQPERNPQTGH
jgi:hypothetical protein